ncbi:hypothetical protein CL629_03190 [bacterium]|nr:hypothetical protein [bacterium]
MRDKENKKAPPKHKNLTFPHQKCLTNTARNTKTATEDTRRDTRMSEIGNVHCVTPSEVLDGTRTKEIHRAAIGLMEFLKEILGVNEWPPMEDFIFLAMAWSTGKRIDLYADSRMTHLIRARREGNNWVTVHPMNLQLIEEADSDLTQQANDYIRKRLASGVYNPGNVPTFKAEYADPIR